MSKTVLHIGTPKTGTTYLQLGLHKNKARLAEAGWCIPNAGCVELGASSNDGSLAGQTVCHHSLAWSLQGDRPLPFGIKNFSAERIWGDLKAELNENNNFLISSECFYWEIRDINSIITIRKFLPENTQIVISLRNRWKFLESMYSQAVYDHNCQQSIMEYMIENISFFDYGAAISQWASVFGSENIKIVMYDYAKDPFFSLLDLIGLGRDGFDLPLGHLNTSVPNFVIPILQKANLDRARHLHLADSAKALCRHLPNYRMLSSKEIESISHVFHAGDLFLQQFGVDIDEVRDTASYLKQSYLYDIRLDKVVDELGAILRAVM